jgi:EF hand
MTIDRNPSADLSSRRNRCPATLFRYLMPVGMGLLLVAMQGQGQQQDPGPVGGDSAALHPGFESLLRGADSVRRDELDRGRQRLFDRIAKRLGVTDGQITRAQLYELSNAPQPSGASGEMLTDGTAATPAGAPPLPNSATEEGMMSGAPAPAANSRPAPQPTSPTLPATNAPLVYHSHNLPKELPAWFRQLDTNHDAQIGLYEWKVSGRSIAEFQRMDRNNDGFLTVEEVLWYLAQTGQLNSGQGRGSRPGGVAQSTSMVR